MDPNVINAIAASAAAAAAIGSWLAASRANRTAKQVAAIEQRREHAERAPRFTITCAAQRGDIARLNIRFTGPDQLHELRIRITIRDDKPRSGSLLAGGPTQAEVAAHVWGPFQFEPPIDRADSPRTIPQIVLINGDGRTLQMRRTPPPLWVSSGEHWHQEYDDKPVRLELHCEHDGYEPWILRREIPVRAAPENYPELPA
ncbi:hypothetical protein [Microbispora sp. GKU 823]|uniref:hypothetical protein n=1 Tax=Microbispora sp. GKU 823 TaxID=1652100 RepID=UPI002117E084|nr:hypothetical protein [Microbispora sp. GKU 823]